MHEPTRDARPLGRRADGLVVAGGFLWILEDDTSIHQADPGTGVVAQTLELKEIEAGPGLLAAGPDSVWGAILCRVRRPELARIASRRRRDPARSRRAVLGRIRPTFGRSTLPRRADRIAVGEGAVWVANDYAAFAEVARFDPAAGSLAETIRIEGGASGIAAGDGALWIANPLADTVSRIDPATNEVIAADRRRRRPDRRRGQAMDRSG